VDLLVAVVRPARALPRFSASISRARNPLEEFTERHAVLSFTILSLLYFAVVATLSHVKLLWLDELITLHIAGLGSASSIWRALASAADPNPPLTHLAVLGSLRLFGDHELALRLPAILGYWVGILSLFLFLRRRLPAIWSLAGTILSMANAAFDYSYESRSYGIFYGLAMLALLCWSRAVDPAASTTRRRICLCGMAIALAAGICTNYFAVLAFLPIAGGELVRSLRRRRFSPHVWIAWAIAATPLLAFHSLIQASVHRFAPHAWNKVSIGTAFDAYTQMVEVILFPVVALLVIAASVYFLSTLCPHCRRMLLPAWLASLADTQADARVRTDSFSFPPHELAAAFLLMIYPFLGYLVASVHGGMLSPRFVIPVCLGFAIAGTAAAHHVFGRLPHAGAIALVLVFATFVGRVCAIGLSYSSQKQCFYQVLRQLSTASGNQPIAVPDPLMALTLAHYAPHSIASRIVFPIDFPAIRLFRGEDSPEENLWAGRNLYHMAIVPLAEFQRSAGDYLILASDGNWLVRDLWNHSYPVNRLPATFPKGAIKGFTPLDHGDPAFFIGSGDRSQRTRNRPAPVPFHTQSNLPDSPSLNPNGQL
jgi:hypothetical protein